MGLTVTTEPTIEPVTVAEVKLYARIDGTDDDAVVNGLISAARRYAEGYTHRRLINTVLTYTCRTFPAERFSLEGGMPQSVASVKYYDTDNSLQTLSSSAYSVITTSTPGRVLLAYGYEWPDVYDRDDAVAVAYTVGYGVTANLVPDDIRLAIKMLVNHYYEQRQPTISGGTISSVPLSVGSLLGPYRIMEFSKCE